MGMLKTIERSIRRAILSLLRSPSPLKENDYQSFNKDRTKPLRILLIRADRIGDVIISTPTIHLLRKHFPDSRIDVLLGHKNGFTAPLIPDIDNHYILEKSPLKWVGLFNRLRKDRYDLAINLHLKPSGSADMAARLAGADLLIERTDQERVNKDLHVVERTSRLLSPLGIVPITSREEDQHPLRVNLGKPFPSSGTSVTTEREKPHRVVLNTSVAGEARRWPKEHYIALARLLQEEGMIPCIAGAPSEGDLIADIVQASGAEHIPPTDDFTRFVSLLGEADIIVTPDTSIVHLAASLQKPVVALYWSDQAGRTWRPWGVPYRTIISKEGMNQISPEIVLNEVKRVISRSQQSRTGRVTGELS